MNKRFGALLGLLFMVGGAFAGVIIVLRGTVFSPKANPEIVPRKVKITNLTENSFAVSWVTQSPTAGFILLGDKASALDRSVADERDQLSGDGGSYRVHHIVARELRPATTYYFKLGSGDKQLYDNNGQPFSVTTAQVLGTPPPPETIYGTVLTPAQTPAEDTIVYLGLPGATPLSALTKQNGNYAVALSTARSMDLVSYADIPAGTMVEMLVQSGRGEESRIKVSLGNAQPVADIVVGETNGVIGAISSPDDPQGLGSGVQSSGPIGLSSSVGGTSDQPSRFVFEDLGQLTGEATEIVIQELPQDNITITETQPTFTGSAPPNTQLTVSIHSLNAYTDQVSVDESGAWQYPVPGTLEPGPHTITVSFTDENGILKQIQRQFIVQAYAADGSPTYTATPSAQVAPTVAPTAIPLPSPTMPPRVANPSTESGVPVASTTAPTIALAMAGMALLLGGGMLYWYQR